jgi:hypothetical protein
MELIKKQFYFKSGTTYNLNILLTAKIKDMGFFDTLDDDVELIGQIQYADNPTGYTFVNSYNFYNYIADNDINSPFPYTVTGTSYSRLGELEKYVVSTDPNIKYFGSGSLTNDGLNSFSIAPASTAFTYFIGGIQYDDVLLSGATAYTTTFSFTVTSFDYNNFDVKRIIKLESKQNMVENPQVGRDVFIVRQQQPVFERNYRLRAVNTLNDVVSYAGGDYFTIFNNT